jgi:excisionase family DNA binding protein
MLNEKVLTVEEVAEHFKVPTEAVKQEIAKGNLRAISVGGYERVLESDLHAYKAGAKGSAHTAKSSVQSEASINLGKAAEFVHTWPDGKKEKFSDAREGTASYLGRNYSVKVGFTTRESAGKARRRSLVLIDRYPTVEFVSAGTNGNGLMASIIKDRSGKQVPVGVAPPIEYASVRVGPYHDVVVGPGAANGMAVICNSDDIQTMVRHALIRYGYRKERQ